MPNAPRNAGTQPLSPQLAIELIFFAFMISAASQFIHSVGPEVSSRFRWIGVLSGAVFFLWGILGLMGFAPHRWAILTLAATTLYLAVEIVFAWRRSAEGNPRIGVLLLALLLMFSIALITMLLAAVRERTVTSELEH